jgi:cytochrome c-type biogenesis protein CcmH
MEKTKKLKLKVKSFQFVTFLILFFFFNNPSVGVEPNEMLKNKKLEEIAREISKNIRCMVCQNQSIDDSNAPLAKDLRILIRDKLKEGKNPKQIYKFLTDRYGDFILLKPAFKLNTLALWLLPFLFFLIGIFIIAKKNIISKKKTY